MMASNTPGLATPLPEDVGLAPMEGVTSFGMRLWFYLTSYPASVGTPFLRVTDTFPHRALPPAYAPELTLPPPQAPYRLVPQLMATEVHDFVRAWTYFPAETQFVELNCGCPAPTCTGKGAGSSLLQNPRQFGDMVGEMALKLGPQRLAIKMRTGYHTDEEFPELLKELMTLPLARLTVHGRTRPQRYRGRARWELIEAAARHGSWPVIASGDVVDRHSFHSLRARAPSIQGVLIGRGALRHPWIFTEIRENRHVSVSRETLIHALATYVLLHEITLAEGMDRRALAEQIFDEGPCGTFEQRWRYVFSHLAFTLTGQKNLSLGRGGQWPDIPLSRNTLGRAKMLWNYMRSGLPDRMFAPLLMRARDLSTFLCSIHECAASEGDHGMEFKHRPELDTLYAGGGVEAENQSSC